MAMHNGLLCSESVDIVLDGSMSLKDSTKINPQPFAADKVYQDVN